MAPLACSLLALFFSRKFANSAPLTSFPEAPWYFTDYQGYDTRTQALETEKTYDTVGYGTPESGQGARIISKGVYYAPYCVAREDSPLYAMAVRLTELETAAA